MRLRTDRLALSPVGDELMLLDLEASTYFAVSSTGAVLVKRLRRPEGAGEDELVATLLDAFDVAEDIARADVAEFVAALRDADLVTE